MSIVGLRLCLRMLFLWLHLAGVLHAALEPSGCAGRIGVFDVDGDDLRIHGVLVTGDDRYPIDVVLRDLGITESELDAISAKPVLLVGEGYSHLLPFLLAESVKAQAVDPAYHQPKYPSNPSGLALAAYVRDFGSHLIQGDAHSLPLPDGSQRRVFSHLLVNNLPDLDSVMGATGEMLRVLEAGGEASIFGYRFFDAPFVEATFRSKGYDMESWIAEVPSRKPGIVGYQGLRFKKRHH